ncbi:MAG: DNA-3-methyladenine glycosylase 2 family protein [Gammaproteobacteria bacterium]|nr:DNA-3-methyladenine glycosylase 2 family protein [Gammaproteobacteria bacterium]
MRWTIALSTPFDWQGVLDYLALRAIPGVEHVDDARYRRTVSLGAHRGWLEVSRHGRTLQVRCEGLPKGSQAEVTRRVGLLFDTEFRPRVLRDCFGSDEILGAVLAKYPGVRVPGCWDGFELTVRTVAGQQVSVRGASTVVGRIGARFGTVGPELPDGLTHWFPTPEQFMVAPAAELGMPVSRGLAMLEVARSVHNGTLSFEPGVTAASDIVAWMKGFTGIKGIGPWTASYVAMRALGYRDAMPAGDLALQRAACLDPTGRLDAKELEARAEAWRPWRAYAAALLWKRYGEMQQQ